MAQSLTPFLDRSKGGRTIGAVLTGQGVYERSKSRCAYPNGMDFDAEGRLHLTWCWRETGDPMTNHDLCYAYSDDHGRIWHNSAGERAGEAGKKPLRVDTPGIAACKIPMRRGLINSTGQAVDGRGRIHAVTWHLPPGAPAAKRWKGARQDRRYFHYWRDLDGRWYQNAIDPKVVLGSRPKLRFDAKDNLYVVFKAGCIAAATAGWQWRDWAVLHAEPGGSLSEPIIDPCRWQEEGVLSIYMQRKGEKPGEPSPLYVLDFKPEDAGGK